MSYAGCSAMNMILNEYDSVYLKMKRDAWDEMTSKSVTTREVQRYFSI